LIRKMINLKTILIVIMLFCLVNPSIGMAQSDKKKIHPTFLKLLKTQPRNKKIMYPLVPRISAKNAYYLFSQKKAVLFGVGLNMTEPILGATVLSLKNEMNPQLINKLKAVKDKYILVFCA
jgi:hypothetical protein